MKYKICYITTLPNTLRFFVIKSAAYNLEQGEWDITFICDETEKFEEELPEKTRYIPVSMKRGFSLSGIVSTWKLYRIFRKEKFDLVQYSTSNAGCYASIAARLARIPVRLYCQWGIDYIYFKGIKRIVFEIIERTICFNSTHVQPDSKENLQIALKEKLYRENKGSVVWNGSASGVDLSRFDIEHKNEWRKEIRNKYNIDAESFVFGYAGRLLGQKGLNEIFDAAKSILKKHQNVKFMLVGADDIIEGLDLGKYEWAKNNENIIFTGFSSQVEKYYAAMDCFLLPSYHEGFGSSIIEAEAMGLPVVASDIPGPREAMCHGKTGLTVPSGDAVALECAIERLLIDRSYAKMLGEEAVEYVRTRFEQNEFFKRIYQDRMSLLQKYINVL